MKKTITLFLLFFCLINSINAQKLSKEEINKYEAEVKGLLSYLEETLNFIGDSTATAYEKEIVFTESWNKIFIDDKVQVEDDLDVNRNTPINKDVQAYLKDIDFFFKNAQFKFDLQSIANQTRDDGSVYFKATLSRHHQRRSHRQHQEPLCGSEPRPSKQQPKNCQHLHHENQREGSPSQLVERLVAKLENPLGRRCQTL